MPVCEDIRVCVECGKELEGKRRKYCSSRCCNRWRMREKRRNSLELREYYRQYCSEYYYANHSKLLAKNIAYRKKIKELMLGHYGRSCVMCGESDVQTLSIDHINNDGAEHRRSITKGKTKPPSTRLYKWLIDNGFPEGFQILCRNCNWRKRLVAMPTPKQTPMAVSSREYRRRVKREVIEHYGRQCALCGEGDLSVLSIDHIGKCGNQHRREIGGNLEVWLRRNGFPDGFRILCQNCQWKER